MAKKKSVLDEIDAVEFPNTSRPTWFERIGKEQQAELLEIRQAYRDGRWKMTGTQISDWLVKKYKLSRSSETVRKWLRSST